MLYCIRVQHDVVFEKLSNIRVKSSWGVASEGEKHNIETGRSGGLGKAYLSGLARTPGAASLMVLRVSASILTLGFSIRMWIGVMPQLVVEEQQQIIRDVQQSQHTHTCGS